MTGLPAVLAVAFLLLLVPSLPGVNAASTTSAGTQSQLASLRARSALDWAASSLSLGAGPAQGAGYSCAAIGGLSEGCSIGGSTTSSSPHANVGWSKFCPAGNCPAPAGRGGAGLTYDPDTGYVVLFGGIVNLTIAPNSSYNDTWTFQNGIWTHLHIPGPAARLGEYMAYDYQDHYVVMFGGGPFLTLNSSLYFHDTWTFQNGSWKELNLSTSPNARGLGGMTWDAADGYLLMYGGMTSQTDIHDDTWTFVGGQWHNLSLTYHPPPLLSPALAYDPAYSYVLLYSGATPSASQQFGQDLQQTWSFAGGAWTNLTSSIFGTVPSGRILSSMAYDPVQGYMVLYGGWNTTIGAAGLYGDTWAYESGFWFRSFVSPPYPAIIGGNLISTTNSSGLLLFGGIVGTLASYAATNQTWSFGPCSECRTVYSVAIVAAPSPTCSSSLQFNGATVVGPDVSISPGGYNVTAGPCPGYRFQGWFPSTGSLTVAAQANATTELYVVGAGTLTAYYTPVASATYRVVSATFGAVVGLLAGLTFVVYWLPRRRATRLLPVKRAPPQDMGGDGGGAGS